MKYINQRNLKIKIMKKVTLFLFSIVAFAAGAMAQGAMTVQAMEFTQNPARFNGKTIAISGLTVNLESATAAPGAVGGAIGGPSAGAPGAMGAGAAVVRCNPPRGFRSLDVDFSNDPNFNKCFYMSEAMYTSLPKGQPSVRAQITFKGDDRLGYTVTMYKLQ